MAVITDPNALGPHVPGVDCGVQGGIPVRPSGSGTLINVALPPYNVDNTGATNAGTGIQSAFNAAAANSVVFLPAGTYKFTTGISIVANAQNKTIRGAGWTTIIDSHVNEAFKLSNSDGEGRLQTVTAGITKGSTQFKVASTTGYVTGQMMFIYAANDTNLPLMDMKGYPFKAGQTVVITSVAGGNTINFYPALIDNFGSGTRTVMVTTGNNQFFLRGIGIEDLLIDGTSYKTEHPATQGAYSGISFSNTLNCWAKNVRVRAIGNYPFMVSGGCHCELRRCWAEGGLAQSSNNAGLLFNGHSAGLIEDNVFLANAEVNVSTQNVLSRNFWFPGIREPNLGTVTERGNNIDTNHNSGTGWNLYEANVSTNILQDGYFGTDQNETFFRNNFPNYFLQLKRFQRNFAFVGNFIFPNTPTSPQNDGSGIRQKASMGLPNIGNNGFTGTAHWPDDPWQDYGLAGTLTTRINDDFASDGVCNNSTAFHSDTITFVDPGDKGVAISGANFSTGTTISAVVGPHDVTLNKATTGGATTTASFNLVGNGRGGAGTITMDGGRVGSLTPATDHYFSFRWDNGTTVTPINPGGYVQDMTVTAVTGSAVSFVSTVNKLNVMPVVGTHGTVHVFGAYGFQEKDLNVEETTTFIGNRYLDNSSFDSLGGDTMPDSFVYTAKPQWLLDAQTELGMTFDLAAHRPETTTTAIRDSIPAAVRYWNSRNIAPSPPVNTSLPAVGGNAVVGDTMTFGVGTWTGEPTPTLTSILRRCNSAGTGCVDVVGSDNDLVYTPVQADVGSTIRIQVTATNASGSAVATSATSPVIDTAPVVNTKSLTATRRSTGVLGRLFIPGGSPDPGTGWATLSVQANKNFTATRFLAIGISRKTVYLLNATLQFGLPGTVGFSRSLTVNGALLPSTQTNFPVLVSITDATLKTVSNGGHVQNANGYDIGFFTDSAGTTPLKWEMERYDGSTGTVVAWVKIPSLSSSSVFYISYGKDTIVTDQSDPVNVWTNSFLSVHHLGNITALSSLDSLGAFNMNNSTGVTTTAGQVGSAGNFVASGSQKLETSSSGPVAGAMTISAWIKAATLPSALNGIVSRGFSGSDYYEISVRSDGKLRMSIFASSDRVYNGTGSHTLSTGTWYYVTLSYDSSTGLYGYVNAASDNTVAADGTVNLVATAAGIGYRRAFGDSYWDGQIDEVRFSSVARSADWITTEYNNQSSPNTFITVGSETGVSGNLDPLTIKVLKILRATATLRVVATLARRINRGFVAVCSFIGTLVTVFTHSGQAFLNFVARLAPLGDLRRSSTVPFGQSFVAVLTFSGNSVRGIGKLINAGLTLSTLFGEQTQREFSATLTFYTSLGKQIYQSFSAALYTVGEVIVGTATPWAYYIDLRPKAYRPTESSKFKYTKANDNG